VHPWRRACAPGPASRRQLARRAPGAAHGAGSAGWTPGSSAPILPTGDRKGTDAGSQPCPPAASSISWNSSHTPKMGSRMSRPTRHATISQGPPPPLPTRSLMRGGAAAGWGRSGGGRWEPGWVVSKCQAAGERAGDVVSCDGPVAACLGSGDGAAPRRGHASVHACACGAVRLGLPRAAAGGGARPREGRSGAWRPVVLHQRAWCDVMRSDAERHLCGAFNAKPRKRI
jgi:hypothetical protein